MQGGVDDASRLEPWIGQLIEGSVGLDAQFVANNGAQDIDADISANDVSGSFGAVKTARIKASVQDLMGVLAIDASADVENFEQPGLRVDRASVGLGGALEDLRLNANVTGEQNGNPMRADLAARASIDGTLQTIGPESFRSLFLDKLDAEIQGQTIQLQAPSAIRLEDGVLDLDQLDLKIGQGTVRSKASLDDDKVFAEVDFADFDLETVEALGGPTMSGDLNGTLSLGGTRQQPSISGSIGVDRLAMIEAEEAESFADIVTEFGVEDGQADLAMRLAGLGEQPIILKASLPIELSLQPFLANADTDQIELNLDGRADLGKVGEFAALDGQVIDGTLVLAMTVEGPTANPSVKGSIGVADGSVEDINTGALLQDIAIMIDAYGDRVEISEFSARDTGNGTLKASGGLGIRGADNYPFDITLDTQDLQLLRSDLGKAWFDIDLNAAGDLKKAEVRGVVKAREIDLEIPSSFGASIDAIEVTEINRPGANNGDASEVRPPMELLLDVKVEMPQKVFIRGRGLDSEWGGELAVKGDANEPVVTGLINFRRGFFDLLDRRFDIDEGVIDFDGAVPPDPTLDFQASVESTTADGEKFDAIVLITGRPSDLSLELTSEPERPQDEVLAQLLFGRDLSEITPGQGVRLVAAASQLAGGTGFDPLATVRDTIGLDTLDVASETVEDSETGETNDQASVRAGKYLTDEVYLEVERGVQPNSGKARVEVELTDTLSANTEFTEDSQTGVGLDWSIDY